MKKPLIFITLGVVSLLLLPFIKVKPKKNQVKAKLSAKKSTQPVTIQEVTSLLNGLTPLLAPIIKVALQRYQH